MQRVDLLPKLVSETVLRSADFGDDLASGETITSQSVTVTVYSGTDASPSSLLSGSASVVGSVVSQVFTAGTLGVIYQALFTAGTSASRTLKRAGYLAVIPDLA